MSRESNQEFMNNKVLKILSKYYEQIYHTIYLCTDDEKLAEEITIKVFAKLYHSAPNFREDITNINWLLENSLRMLKYMEKCENKKDRKCHTLSMLNNEQIAILYMESYMELPFEEIVSIMGRTTGNVRRQISKGKDLLITTKDIKDIKGFISKLVEGMKVVEDKYSYIVEDIKGESLKEITQWEKKLRRKILKKHVMRYYVAPILVVSVIAIVTLVIGCIRTKIVYDNWNIFEVMNYGDMGEEFEVNEIAKEDGRSFQAGKMKVTLEKSWYSENWRMGYCYFVITYEGRDMRLEDIKEPEYYCEDKIIFGPEDKYTLVLENDNDTATMSKYQYYTTEDKLYLAFRFRTSDIVKGERLSIRFKDEYKFNEGGIFTFGEIGKDEPYK